MAAQAVKWAVHVATRVNRKRGPPRPKRSTMGVARAHGSRDRSKVTNSAVHAWCIPSERITKTVLVASMRPIPSQIDTFQIHHVDRGRINFPAIVGIIF